MRPHSFSRTFAKEQRSISQALVLEEIVFRIRATNKVKDGKQWFYDSLNELQDKLPFLKRTAIDDAIKKLASKGFIEVGNYNKAKYDKTRWYHVPEEHWAAVDEEKVWFQQADAVEHGIPAALLMNNLDYWIAQKFERNDGETHAMSPTDLSKHLPVSKSTIKATLADLVEKGVLVKIDGKRSHYAFAPDRMRQIQTRVEMNR
ncbi:MAG: helix-turn-helix domain-containing protein [Prosthecobacter sp.]